MSITVVLCENKTKKQTKKETKKQTKKKQNKTKQNKTNQKQKQATQTLKLSYRVITISQFIGITFWHISMLYDIIVTTLTISQLKRQTT